MLWRWSELEGYEIAARDGVVGPLDDLLYDDRYWGVRWMVVDTGNWLARHEILLPPEMIGAPRGGERRLRAALTRRQVEASPPIDADAPISREAEAKLFGHYGGKPYWSGDYEPPFAWLAGGGGVGGFLLPPVDDAPHPAPTEPHVDKPPDPHLEGVRDTTGLAIRALDGDVGHVADFVVDDEGWVIRYMIVDTGKWLPGRKVLVAPRWVRSVDWAGRRFEVDLTRQAIEDSPPYDPSRPPTREEEIRLHAHYGRPGYWA
jgi:hypothetical protein